MDGQKLRQVKIDAIKHLNCLPCLYLSLDCTPPLCHLTGSLLIAFQLWAAIWVESVELGSNLFGTVDLRLQGVKDALVFRELRLPLLGEKRKEKIENSGSNILHLMTVCQWLCYPELVPKAFNGCDVSRDNIFFT